MDTSNITTYNQTPSKGLRQWIKQHPLVAYFTLAYAFSWIVFIPYILGEWEF